jgi:spore germination protein YaaH
MRAAAICVLLLLAACAAPPVAVSPMPDKLEMWAYHAHWMGEGWRAHDLSAFDRVLLFDLVAGKDGRITQRNGWPERWEGLRAKARAAGIAVDPVVSILGKPAFDAIFTNPDASARLVAEIAALARNSEGIHLDIEVFDPVDDLLRERFRAFVATLRRSLDAKLFSAFVPIKGGLYGPAELAMLDVVVAQGYDVHWQTAPTAGPVSLLGEVEGSWQAMARMLAEAGVPSRKILFSTPFYGYEWPTVSDEPGAKTRGPGAIITFAPVPASLLPDLRIDALTRSARHGLRRDAASGAPYYAFRDKDGWKQGWFDDAVSLPPRLEFVRAGRYRGVALFVLGYDGGTLVQTVQAAFRAGSGAAAGVRPAGVR